MQPTDPLPRPPDSTVILAVAGMIVALLIGVTILAVFAPTLALPMTALLITVVVGTGIPALLSLGNAAEAKATAAAAKAAAKRVEGKTDAIQVSVDGRITDLINSIEGRGVVNATNAGLQATLDEKAAQAGRENATALATAAASGTDTTTTTVTTLHSPATSDAPVIVAPPTAAAAPPEYAAADNYPDGPTPFGPPPSPETH